MEDDASSASRRARVVVPLTLGSALVLAALALLLALGANAGTQDLDPHTLSSRSFAGESSDVPGSAAHQSCSDAGVIPAESSDAAAAQGAALALSRYLDFLRSRAEFMPAWGAYRACVEREGTVLAGRDITSLATTSDSCWREYDEVLWQLSAWEVGPSLTSDQFGFLALERSPEELWSAWLREFERADPMGVVALLAMWDRAGPGRVGLTDSALVGALGTRSIAVRAAVLDHASARSDAPQAALADNLARLSLDDLEDGRIRGRATQALGHADCVRQLEQIASRLDSASSATLDSLSDALPLALGRCGSRCEPVDENLLASDRYEVRVIGLRAALVDSADLSPTALREVELIARSGREEERELADRVIRSR